LTDDDDNTTTEITVADKSHATALDGETAVSQLISQVAYQQEVVTGTNEAAAEDIHFFQHSDTSSPLTDSAATVSSDGVADILSAKSYHDADDLSVVGTCSSFLHADAADLIKSTDRESVVSSHSSEPSGWSALSSSDIAKSDGLIVVSATPDRTTPSEEGSSNAKGMRVTVLN